MGIKCRIIRNPKTNEIENVEAPNGAQSVLFDDAVSFTKNKEEALDLWTVSYLDKFKEVYGNSEFPKKDVYNNITENFNIQSVEGKPNIFKITVNEATVYFKERVNPITNEKTGEIELDLIETPKKLRGQGRAKQAMQEFLNYVDAQNKPVYLIVSPSTQDTTEEGLKDFYKQFGFVSQDFDLEMIRQPKNSSSEEFLKFQKTPTFFSNLQEAAKNIKDKNKKNVTGWMNVLTDVQKNNGIRNVNQEAEWIGLEDYLNEYTETNQPKNGNIPFEVVKQYVEDNQIEIVEVSKGTGKDEVGEINWGSPTDSENDPDYGETDTYITSKGNTVTEFFDDKDKSTGVEVYIKKTDKKYDFNKREDIPFEITRQDTNHSSYQLEGSERYREVLFTLPNKNQISFEDWAAQQFGDIQDLSDNQLRLAKSQYESSKDRDSKEVQEGYTSPEAHYSEKNILAHVRMNERTLPNGERVLFVEEIQSDWNQSIKKSGFKGDTNIELPFSEEEYTKLQDRSIEIYKKEVLEPLKPKKEERKRLSTQGKESEGIRLQKQINTDKKRLKEKLIEGNQEYKNIEGKLELWSNANNSINKEKYSDKAPNNPYKKTDKWVGMAMRRVMQMASQEGFDRVAWITGEQSADRYSLSKQVDKIDVEKVAETEGVFFVDISLSNGTTQNLEVEDGVVREGEFEGKGLDEIVGKDLAKSILEGESKTIQGEGLKVGGEGMKTFYNSIVPKVAKKEAQRFDKSAKVEVIDFRNTLTPLEKGGYSFDSDIGVFTNTNSIVSKEDYEYSDDLYENYEQGVGYKNKKGEIAIFSKNKTDANKYLDRIIEEINSESTSLESQDLPQNLQEWGKRVEKEWDESFDTNEENAPAQQLSIKLTPKMKNALQEAVPLFQQGGQNRVQEGELEMFQEQLEKTGLASSTTLLDSQEIEAELVKRGENTQKTTNGFVDTKTREVFINKDTANGETMLHEYNHLYTSWLKQNKSEVYNKGIALVNEELNTEGSQIQSVINFVKQNQPNLKGEALAEEILTQIVGERGIELLQAGKEGTILSWLKEAWESIKNLLGLSQYSLEEVMQMDIQKYADAMAVDLVSGKNLTKKAEQPNPFTDQNGEVKLEHVLEFLEQESKTEAEPLTKEEEIIVENILRTKGINSDELTDEVNRLFKGGSLNRNALENSSIFNKAEQIQVLQSKEYQDNLQKLANQEIKVEDNVEFERDFLVLDGTINKYGLYNTKNPLTIEKEIKDKVADISNYEDFANAFNQLDYQGIVNKFNTEEDFAYKMFFKYSQLKKVKEEGKKQPNKKIEVENSLDISKLPLSSINMLLETSNEVWNESQQEVEQALTEIELQSISSGLDLQNLADFYTKKERAEFFELLESLRNLKRDTTEYNFSTFLDIYSNFYNLEEQDYQNAEEVDITHRNKELVRVRDYGMSEYDMFTKKDLIKIEDGLYQKIEKVSLENLYEMVYAEAVNNDNRLLPTTAYFNSLQIDNQRLQNPQNKEEVISNIKLFIQSSIGKLDLSNDSYSSDVAEQLLLYKYYFEAPMSFSDKTLNKTDLALIDNFDKKFNPFNFITLFQSNKLQERRKNSSNYKNFYKHFTIDQTGIRPIEEDSITLNILAKSIPVKLSKDFTNYAAVSRNVKVKEIVRIEKLLFTPKETYKKFYQNNYKALPNFKGEYQKIETDGITTSDKTDDFLRVGDKLYQRVDVKAGQAFYRQIPTNTEEFNIFYDFEKINNFAQDKVNPYIRRQENVESTNNFYTKKEIEEINKKHFDCS